MLMAAIDGRDSSLRCGEKSLSREGRDALHYDRRGFSYGYDRRGFSYGDGAGLKHGYSE